LAARRIEVLQERQAFLFCTDLTNQTACVFAAYPEDSGYLFEEWRARSVGRVCGRDQGSQASDMRRRA
jgi:hypothetical protein